MVIDVRTVIKSFNRDLLLQELVATTLPFVMWPDTSIVKMELSGFEISPSNRFIRIVPSPLAPVFVTSKRNPDKTYTKDFADPGEIRFQFTTDLTVAEGETLDSLLFAHDSTQITAEQQRLGQDETDVDSLIEQFPDIDSFNLPQVKSYLILLARAYLRDKRQPSI